MKIYVSSEIRVKRPWPVYFWETVIFAVIIAQLKFSSSYLVYVYLLFSKTASLLQQLIITELDYHLRLEI